MKALFNLGKIVAIFLTWLWFLVKKASTPKYVGTYHKILVLYITGMGDIVCLTPFYEKIRTKFPDAETWACFPQGFVELENEFFQFDGYIEHSSYRKTLKEINEQNYDLVILPGWLLKDSLLALASNAKSILGFINELTFSNRYLNEFTMEGVGIEVSPQSQDMRKSHLSERPNVILAHFGMPPISRKDLHFKRENQPENYIVIHAGARFEGRRWSPANFSEVIRHVLVNRFAENIYLIGDASDRRINTEIISLTGLDQVHDLAGQLSLLQTKHLISKAVLFIGNDSGPMHIAAVSGIPTLGLLGPNFPHISGPMGDHATAIFHKFSCSGCNQRQCNYDMRCMKAITVSEVIKEIERLTDEKTH